MSNQTIQAIRQRQVPVTLLTGFNLDAILEIEPDFLEDVAHKHDDDISSFVFRSARPFAVGKLEAFLSQMLTEHGADMLRYKGVLNIAAMPGRVVFQGAT